MCYLLAMIANVDLASTRPRMPSLSRLGLLGVIALDSSTHSYNSLL